MSHPRTWARESRQHNIREVAGPARKTDRQTRRFDIVHRGRPGPAAGVCGREREGLRCAAVDATGHQGNRVTEFLFAAHSGFRYIVLTIGLVTAAAAAAALVGGPASTSGRLAFRFFRVFGVLVDIQVLLGIGVVFTRPFLSVYIGHLVMMVLALAVVHGLAVFMKRKAPEHRETGPILAGVAVALALIAGGILAIGRPIF
jgi:hypothetical protein